MKLESTSITGVYTVTLEKAQDERGFFARTWDTETAQAHNLVERFDYTCVSRNKEKGTLRGMHYQRDPHGETKLVRCTQGRILDVVIDLRPDSPTFKKWISQELSSDNHVALYIPTGCVHGFITLEPDTEVLYHIAGAYNQEASTGVRWNDPAFSVTWPMEPTVISERDATYPDFVQ